MTASDPRLWSSVPDPNPDPPDPHVFGPPGSGSGSISKKNLDSYNFVTLFEVFFEK